MLADFDRKFLQYSPRFSFAKVSRDTAVSNLPRSGSQSEQNAVSPGTPGRAFWNFNAGVGTGKTIFGRWKLGRASAVCEADVSNELLFRMVGVDVCSSRANLRSFRLILLADRIGTQLKSIELHRRLSWPLLAIAVEQSLRQITIRPICSVLIGICIARADAGNAARSFNGTGPSRAGREPATWLRRAQSAAHVRAPSTILRSEPATVSDCGRGRATCAASRLDS